MITAALAAALLWGGPGQAAAQSTDGRRDPSIADSVFGRFIATSLRSGPPGTEVTLRPMYLPSVTPVQISIGGTRSGFEVLAQMMTDQQGKLSEAATFRIPDWAERDRTYMFMVLDLYFKPLAASDPFFVTGPDGTLARHGRITGEGVACPTLRGEGNELYVLLGKTDGLQPGDSVRIEGAVANSAECPQGTAIDVVRVQRLGPTGSSPREPGSAAPAEFARQKGHSQRRQGPATLGDQVGARPGALQTTTSKLTRRSVCGTFRSPVLFW